MSVKLSPIFQDAQLDSNGNPLAGGKIYWYFANTSTPATTYTTVVGDVAQANPIILNSRGEPANPIWITTGSSYKAVLKDSVDATIRTIDYITGVGDSTTVTSEWADLGITPTYLTGSSFTVPGDQTVVLHPGIRIKTTNTGGFLYGFVKTSIYSAPNTTVTVNLSTSSFLDSGLSKVEYSIISANYPSTPGKIDATEGNVFWKNHIINGNFTQVPRGTTWATGGLTGPTKWYHTRTGSTFSATQQTLTANPGFKYYSNKYYQNVVTTSAGAGNFVTLDQKIRSVTTLEGQYVTLNFWAKEAAAKNLAVEMIQDFGQGGSPSSDVSILPLSGSGIVDLTTSWAFYSIPFFVPSITGKTIGTTLNSSYLCIKFWFDAGATYATQSSSLGQQSGTFSIAQVTLIPGIYPVEVPQPTFGEDVLECSQWSQLTPRVVSGGYGAISTVARSTISIPEMIEVPTILTQPSPTEVNCSGTIMSVLDKSSVYWTTTVTAAGTYYFSTAYDGIITCEIAP